MNYVEALNYINRGFFSDTRPGLERITELLELLGNPQNSLSFIHVAGTNGKGSFCSMMDYVLREAGYKTGLYTSPFIERFNERIVIDGVPISDEELAETTEYVGRFADSMEDKPTEFELITAIAMVCFKKHKVYPVILEVGLGGRLDATNVISTSIISVITGISLDHTAILGNTEAKIAAEKAGIIRPGVTVVWGGSSSSAGKVIKRVCESVSSPLVRARRKRIKILEFDLYHTVFKYDGITAEIFLLGEYQPQNAANVICAVKELRKCGLNVSDEAIVNGLKKARWKARFEKISSSPLIIYDGSHNPEGVTLAVKSIRDYFADKKVILFTGVLKDKDYKFMAKMLSEVADRVFTITPNNPRALDAEKYAGEFVRNGIEAEPSVSIEEAARKVVSYAKSNDLPVVCLGSLYIYKDVVYEIRKLVPDK